MSLASLLLRTPLPTADRKEEINNKQDNSAGVCTVACYVCVCVGGGVFKLKKPSSVIGRRDGGAAASAFFGGPAGRPIRRTRWSRGVRAEWFLSVIVVKSPLRAYQRSDCCTGVGTDRTRTVKTVHLSVIVRPESHPAHSCRTRAHGIARVTVLSCSYVWNVLF